MTYPPNNL